VDALKSSSPFTVGDYLKAWIRQTKTPRKLPKEKEYLYHTPEVIQQITSGGVVVWSLLDGSKRPLRSMAVFTKGKCLSPLAAIVSL
jgi:hypothetical protein